MSRYIDADKALEVWKDQDYIKLSSQETKARIMLDAVPTADVVEVRHSVWRVALADPDKEYECMKCKKAVGWKYLYCPNCGARMDGKAQDHE